MCSISVAQHPDAIRLPSGDRAKATTPSFEPLNRRTSRYSFASMAAMTTRGIQPHIDIGVRLRRLAQSGDGNLAQFDEFPGGVLARIVLAELVDQLQEGQTMSPPAARRRSGRTRRPRTAESATHTNLRRVI